MFRSIFIAEGKSILLAAGKHLFTVSRNGKIRKKAALLNIQFFLEESI